MRELSLHRLATLALQAPPESDTLRLTAQLLRKGAGAEEAHVVYVPAAQQFFWASDPPCREKPIDDGGLTYVQRRLAATGVPLAFNVTKNRRVEELAPAREARDRRWLAFRVPGRANFSDMLLVRGAWSGRLPEKALHFLEASLPSLTVFIGRFLDAFTAAEQRQRLNALSEVARAITQTQDMEEVLTRLATTIAAVTNYELVLLDVLADDGLHLRHRCINQSRWSESPQTRLWREWGLTREVEPRYLEVARTRHPGLFPDLQHDERVPPEGREFFRHALLASSAVVPLCFGDEVLGFLVVTSSRPCRFPPEEVQLLEGLAAQVAAAIRAIQNYQELEASRERLREYADRLRDSAEIQRQLACTDALTGIPNRRYVEEFLIAECARSRRVGSPLSVVLADVDDFKNINDTLGHHAGDRVLVELAQLARTTCRAMDVVGRYGGDELVFVLPLASVQDAAKFAQRFRKRVARRRIRLSSEAAARVTVSLGVAELTSDRSDPDAILQRADEALYRAKAQGKNRVCVEGQQEPVAA